MRPIPTLRRSLRLLAGAAAALLVGAASPAAAQLITIGDGSNPPPPSLCPGDTSMVQVNQFVLTHPGTATVRGVRLKLVPAGAYQLVARVEVRQGANVWSVVPTSDYPIVNFPTPVTIGSFTGTIWLGVKGADVMPDPGAGGAPEIGATVESLVANYSSGTTGDRSSTLSIDNKSPANASWTGSTPGATNIALSWRLPADATGVLLLRRAGGPIVDSPAEGVTTYAPPQTIGQSTVAAAGAGTSFNDTGRTAGTAYYYRLFTRDACQNWSTGTSIGPLFAGGIAVGDPTDGSVKPVVGLLNPLGGVVTSPFRVQVRVFSPNGQAIQSASLLVDNGTTVDTKVLARNANFGTAPDSGVFEYYEAGVPGLTLLAGSYTLRAQATNAAGVVSSAPVGIIVNALKGDGNLLVRDNSSQLCEDCHALKTHSSETTSNAKGSWFVGCRACHTPHNTANAALVRDEIQPPGVHQVLPPSNVQFSKRTGFYDGDVAVVPADASYANTGSVAEPSPRRTGVCQVCHTQTLYYRADGSEPRQLGSPEGHHTSSCGTCHKHSDGFKGSGCNGCHGTQTPRNVAGADPLVDAAPPVSPTTAAPIVANGGVHLAHVAQNTFRTNPLPCASCHSGFTHADGDVDLGWSSLATGSGAKAVVPTPAAGPTTVGWVSSPSCTNYCHGASLTDGFTPSRDAVSWGTPATLDCGSCHGAPPNLSPHTSGMTDCGGCHPAGYSPVARTVNGDSHIDGTVQAQGCTGCHGGTKVAASGTIQSQVDAMPPNDTTGSSATTNQGVGAHVQHANSDTSLALPLACTDCHSWAAFPSDATHYADGMSPMQASINWNPGNNTCSAAACHMTAAPVWTQVDGSFKTCGSCHAAPPAITLNHPQNGTCSSCHTGYATPATVNRNTHVDGALNVNTASGCARCHGSLGNGVVATSIDAAPGVNSNVDSHGNLASATNLASVGAHKAHLQPRYFNGAVACTQCHPSPSYSDATHANATAAVPFPAGSLARNVLPGDPIQANPAYASPSCNNTYCHGEFTGGTRTDPSWTGAGYVGTSMTCSSCHGLPPDVAANHPQNSACEDCHTGYTSGSVALATHINGAKDVTTSTGCARCHGLLGTNGVAYGVDAAPGVSANHYDSHGNNAATVNTVGAHAVHVQAGSLAGAFACSQCHTASIADTTHANGALGFAWGSIATDGGRLVPSYSAGYQCSNVYCHSRANPLGGTDAAPASQAWNVTTNMGCTSCHGDAATSGAAALSPKHAKHLASGTYNMDCSVCHAATGTRTAITTPANHVNGQKNFQGGAYRGASIGGSYTSNVTAPNYTCNTTYCHSNGASGAPTRTTLNWNTGAANADCADCHGGNASAGVVLGTGSHTAHITDSPAYKGTTYGCVTCHDATVSDDRTLDPVAVSTKHINGAKDVSAGGWASPSCTANACHSDGTETPGYVTATWGTPLANDCKACHGRNGASVYGDPDYAERVSTSDDVRNSHSKHVNRGDVNVAKTQCITCHESTIDATGALKAPAAGGTHLNFSVEITSGAGKKIGSYNQTGEQCSNIECHGGNGASWGGAALTCTNCHGGAADSPNWNIADNLISVVSTVEFAASGHGQTTTQFNELTAAGVTDKCVYCHDNTSPTAAHGTASNPFRLRGAADVNGATGAYNALSADNGNEVCLNCHDTGTANGVDPDGAGGQPRVCQSTGANPCDSKIDSWHYGADHLATQDGGKRCWDCHDPHGDGNIMMVAKRPLRDSTDDHGLAGTRVAIDVSFTATTAASNFVNTTTRNGVCQVCHTTTSFWQATADATRDAHQPTTVCLSCHDHHNPPNFAFKGAGDCTLCHAQTQAITVGPEVGQAARRNIVAEFKSTWSHKASTNATPANRTVTKEDCVVCHMEGSPSDASLTGAHADGYVDLRDPDTGTTIMEVEWVTGPTTAGHYQNKSPATPARFGRFYRNLSSNVLEEPVKAVMINQCLKCHDSNGAMDPSAQVSGGSAGKPFAQTITWSPFYAGSYGMTACATGTNGCVTNIDASFVTSNASYHPVKGKQNNSYTGNAQMQPPWNALSPNKTAGNITAVNAYGYLISCWDCHSTSGAAGTRVGTPTAHGGAATVRANIWVSNRTNTGNLCRVCHFSTNVTRGHGTGSAAASTDSNATPYMGAACNYCHLSAWSKPPRPLPGQDFHGFDAFAVSTVQPALGTTDKMWPIGTAESYKPYAFMRNVGSRGGWRSTTISWKPRSGPRVPTGNATCGSDSVNFSIGSCNNSHGSYAPGGVY